MKRKPRRGRALWLVLSPDGNETLQQYIERHNIDPQTGLAREIEQPGWGLSDLPEMRTKPKLVNQGD
jgi:hypothetical protein